MSVEEMADPREKEMSDLFHKLCISDSQHSHMLDMLSKDIQFSSGYGSAENVQKAKKKFEEFLELHFIVIKEV